MKLIIEDEYIKYVTEDKKAYVEIEQISDEVWHICMIESKRKGGGTELINRIIFDAKLSGIKKITLSTIESTASGFFNKFGFIEVGEDNDKNDIPMVLFL